MSLFLSLLPIYIFGNLHCMGMCGPLVALLGRHKWRHLYFLGRLCSFSLAGLLSAEMGQVITATLKSTHLPALTSFLFGGLILLFGFSSLFNFSFPGKHRLARITAPLSAKLGILMGQNHPFATFAFGFCTILLPCGQTMIVFTAVALSASPLVGLFNGFCFALLTSPALFIAMHSHRLFPKGGKMVGRLIGICSLLIGTIAIMRGVADLSLISHCTLNTKFHLVLY